MATNIKHEVTIPVTVDRDELMNNVMGSAWETWSWWTGIQYADGCDWKTYPSDHHAPYVTITSDDPDMGWDESESESITKTLTIHDILTAVGEVLTRHPWIRWDNMDACDSDLVLQYAVLGKVVYG